MQYPKEIMTAEFDKYKEEISHKALEHIAISYDTYEQIGYDWRTKRRYDAETERALIIETRNFIRRMDRKNLWSCDPDFLAPLAGKMGGFLAVYTVRKNPIADDLRNRPEFRGEYNKLKDAAEKELRRVLYTEFDYIQRLKTEFPKIVLARQNPHSKTARAMRKNDRKKTAAENYQCARAVRGLFSAETKHIHKR